MRQELRTARRHVADEREKLKQNAEKFKHDLMYHTNRHADAYLAKREITETKFMMGLSDEETADLIAKNRTKEQEQLEEKWEKHRIGRERKMGKLYGYLQELEESRDVRDVESRKKRKEKREAEEEEKRKLELHEEEQILLLEKKCEKKRQEKLRLAEEADEHMRQIAVRNRYLALNQRELETRGFESRQEARLRTAKEKQDEKLIELPELKKKTKKGDLVNLRAILGI
jgi:hypothetical protein